MKVRTGWNWTNSVSVRLSYKYTTANEKCQLQITGKIRARTASDKGLQNVNFYVSFATCVTITCNFSKVSSCSRKMYDVNRILQKHKQRALQKNWGLVRFSAVFCLFAFAFWFSKLQLF